MTTNWSSSQVRKTLSRHQGRILESHTPLVASRTLVVTLASSTE